MMILLNFSKLDEGQLEEIKSQCGDVHKIVNVPVEPDWWSYFHLGQADELVDQTNLTPDEWRGERIMVALPDNVTLAATILAAMYGRMGYLPYMVSVRYNPDKGKYEEVDIIPLHIISDMSRKQMPPGHDGAFSL